MKHKNLNADLPGPRYRAAAKEQKSLILTGFRANNHYHRKHAISLPRKAGKTRLMRVGKKTAKLKITAHRRPKRLSSRFYDDGVHLSAVALREFFRRVCAKRLVPVIRANPGALAADKRFRVTGQVKEKLKTISVPALERMLKTERARHKLRGNSRTKPGTLPRHQIPVRVFRGWEDKQPGFCGIDTISHDGGFIPASGFNTQDPLANSRESLWGGS